MRAAIYVAHYEHDHTRAQEFCDARKLRVNGKYGEPDEAQLEMEIRQGMFEALVLLGYPTDLGIIDAAKANGVNIHIVSGRG